MVIAQTHTVLKSKSTPRPFGEGILPDDRQWAASVFGPISDERDRELFAARERAARLEALGRLLDRRGYPDYCIAHVLDHAARWGEVRDVGPSFLLHADRAAAEAILAGEDVADPEPEPEPDDFGRYLIAPELATWLAATGPGHMA